MASRWVVNASPLIALCKIDHHSLLFDLTDELIIPQAVAGEIAAGPADDPARNFLADAPLAIADVPSLPAVLAWDLGAGESAVLSHAVANPGWTAVIDDGAARRCARTLGVPLIGTLGIVIQARHRGLIPAAAPVLKALASNGFRLRDDVIREALARSVNEAWP